MAQHAQHLTCQRQITNCWTCGCASHHSPMTCAPALQALLPGSRDCLDGTAVAGKHQCSVSYCSGGWQGMQPGALPQCMSPASVLLQRLLMSHATCIRVYTGAAATGCTTCGGMWHVDAFAGDYGLITHTAVSLDCRPLVGDACECIGRAPPSSAAADEAAAEAPVQAAVSARSVRNTLDRWLASSQQSAQAPGPQGRPGAVCTGDLPAMRVQDASATTDSARAGHSAKLSALQATNTSSLSSQAKPPVAPAVQVLTCGLLGMCSHQLLRRKAHRYLGMSLRWMLQGQPSSWVSAPRMTLGLNGSAVRRARLAKQARQPGRAEPSESPSELCLLKQEGGVGGVAIPQP